MVAGEASEHRLGMQAEANGEDTPLPLVSVLLPVRNEAPFIRDCLEALAAQDYPRERFEVILIDGESSDRTLTAVAQAQAEIGLPDKVLTNSRRTTPAGLNLGLSAAAGDVIVRVDGHTHVDPTFLSASVRMLLDSGADAVGGPIRTRGDGDVGRAIALAMSSRFGIGDTAFRYSDVEQETDSVPFAAYRRDVFDRIGGFAEVSGGEDDEFNYRLRDNGGRILLSPAIGSDYYCRDSLAGLARQYWRYGIAKSEVLARHPRRIRLRHFVPSALVLTLAGSALLSYIDRRLGWLTLLAGGAYAIANATATRKLAGRADGRGLRYLPAAFATIHFAAGSGMLAGFLRQAFSGRRQHGE
jgi:cellulose synthase/poly-beta-1,6-N-acetylglucosamine synthase-like glycosyltransferase